MREMDSGGGEAAEPFALLTLRGLAGPAYIPPTDLAMVQEVAESPLQITEQGWLYNPDHTLRRPVAIKSFRPGVLTGEGALRAFATSLLQLHNLRHPNLLRVLGMGCYNPHSWRSVAASVYMIEEWGGYMSVARLIRAGQLSPGEPTLAYTWLDALRWCVNVADALAFLHSRGVYHGDVSTRNIFFTSADVHSTEARLGDLKPHRCWYHLELGSAHVSGAPSPALVTPAPSASLGGTPAANGKAAAAATAGVTAVGQLSRGSGGSSDDTELMLAARPDRGSKQPHGGPAKAASSPDAEPGSASSSSARTSASATVVEVTLVDTANRGLKSDGAVGPEAIRLLEELQDLFDKSMGPDQQPRHARASWAMGIGATLRWGVAVAAGPGGMWTTTVAEAPMTSPRQTLASPRNVVEATPPRVSAAARRSSPFADAPMIAAAQPQSPPVLQRLLSSANSVGGAAGREAEAVASHPGVWALGSGHRMASAALSREASQELGGIVLPVPIAPHVSNAGTMDLGRGSRTIVPPAVSRQGSLRASDCQLLPAVSGGTGGGAYGLEETHSMPVAACRQGSKSAPGFAETVLPLPPAATDTLFSDSQIANSPAPPCQWALPSGKTPHFKAKPKLLTLGNARQTAAQQSPFARTTYHPGQEFELAQQVDASNEEARTRHAHALRQQVNALGIGRGFGRGSDDASGTSGATASAAADTSIPTRISTNASLNRGGSQALATGSYNKGPALGVGGMKRATAATSTNPSVRSAGGGATGNRTTKKSVTFAHHAAANKLSSQAMACVNAPPEAATAGIRAACCTGAGDVYAFAQVMYEAFLRDVVLPVGDTDGQQWAWIQDHVAATAKGDRGLLPSKLPPPLRALIEQCWSQAPNQRPSMANVAQRLRALMADHDFKETLLYSDRMELSLAREERAMGLTGAPGTRARRHVNVTDEDLGCTCAIS